MKKEHHERKTRNLENSIAKLDTETDSELVIEAYVLIASHQINTAMHKLGSVNEDRDIKHNKLPGFIKRENSLGEKSSDISYLLEILENLRPSEVYGKGTNGTSARRAKEVFEEIKKLCESL